MARRGRPRGSVVARGVIRRPSPQSRLRRSKPAFVAGCGTVHEPTQFAAWDEFPPPVIWGVMRFAEKATNEPVPDSSVDKPVMWVRFGVTKEAADRETALATSRPGAGAGKGS